MAPTRPLSIVFLVDGWQPFFNAGGETAAGEIARWLNQRGHRTTAIIPRLPREATRFEWAGTHIYRRGSTRWTDRTIRNVDADVIITQLVATDLGTDYATRLGLPLAHLVHNDHTLENHNVTAGDLIISNAKWVDERTPERAAHIDRIVVHPPTIGLDQIPTSDPRRRWLTIVNASEIKGGAIFGELARRRPRLPFLTVTGGYGKHPQPQTPTTSKSSTAQP